MCGLAGFIDSGQTLDSHVLEKMLNVIHHRGPDFSSAVLLNRQNVKVGLGHNRLSILDLTNAGIQPMNFNGMSLIFNGEIYNFKSIRSELENDGYCFETSTDTEVILKSFDKWGKACVDKFIGMFSFVIVKEDKVYFCRDRAGVKPLYYYFNGRQFIFASELKSILENPCFVKEIDSSGVESFFKFGYIEDALCIYKDTYKLTPGNWLIFDINSFSFELEQYWDVSSFYEKPKLDLSFSDIKDRTEELMHDAFKFRMVSDVPIGIFLSGGYDSNCLLGVLASSQSYKLNTFSVGFENFLGNETPISRRTSQLIGSDHSEIICTQPEIENMYNKMASVYDEPYSDVSSIPSLIICEVARENGITVALSADGGDEIFGGYNKYLSAIDIVERSKGLSSFSKSFISHLNSMSLFALDYVQSGRLRQYLEIYSKKSALVSMSPERVLKTISEIFSESDLNFLLMRRHFDEKSMDEYGRHNSIEDTLDKLLCIDYKTYMRDDILTKIDRAGMNASIEVREPFLDHRIIEWVATIPSKYKINGENITKFLLKDITHDYIPEALLNKKKQGFSFPVLMFLKEAIENQIECYLNPEYIRSQGLFNYSYVNSLVNDFRVRPDINLRKIWLLVNFQAWYDRWILKG